MNSDLTFSSSFGKECSDKGQFNRPRDINCDGTGKVYVANQHNHRIQLFTAKGKFLRMFGRRGEGREELVRPIGITIDTSDRVYVGDCNHRISVFTSEGQFVTSFGREGKEPGEFEYHCGLAVDVSGVVYVCDSNNNRIQLFMYLHCYSEFMSVHTCIILVSMYLHCYSEFNVSPHMYLYCFVEVHTLVCSLQFTMRDLLTV